MGDVHIRSARVDDAASLIEHMKHVFSENPSFYGTAVEEFTMSLKEEEQWIESHLVHGLLLLAEIERQLVGMIHFKPSSSRRFAHQGTLGISVKEEYAGLGIGTRLIEQLLVWAKENHSIEKVTLEVFSNNARGIHLYKKLGFSEEGRLLRNAKLDDGTYVDDIIMSQFV